MTDNLFWTRKAVIRLLKSYGATPSQGIKTYHAMQKTYFDDAKKRNLLVISNQVPRKIVWDYLEAFLGIHPEDLDGPRG